jgi:hypothetical protein
LGRTIGAGIAIEVVMIQRQHTREFKIETIQLKGEIVVLTVS